MIRNFKITTDRCVDPHSIPAIAGSVVRTGMTNEEKALACYEVVRKGMFQYPTPYDVKLRREEWHDPVKLLNVYGHGLCGTQARVLGAIYQEVFGYDNQRLTGLGEREIGDWDMGRECGAFVYSLMQKNHSLENRQGHSTVEVLYDGTWHHLDPMVEYYTYWRNGDSIAGLEDCLEDPSLVESPTRSVTGVCPDGDISVIYTKSQLPTTWTPGPGYYIARDTSMEIELVPGRKVTWLWNKLDGMFIWPEVILERFGGEHFDDGPRHPETEQSRWRHFGNGILTQRMDVCPKEGYELTFPYPFVDGRLLFTADRAGGRVALRSSGARDQECVIECVEGANEVRLGDAVREGYGLHIVPSDLKVTDVALELFFQHNFIMRPRLMPGDNSVKLRGDTGEGDRATVTWVWEEVGDGGESRRREDRRTAGMGDVYDIHVGPVSTESDINPKYMKSLTVELASGETGSRGETL